MYQRYQSLRKIGVSEHQCGSRQLKSGNVQPSETTRRDHRVTSNKENNNKESGISLPFKIPMSYVVSGAAALCSEAKCAKKIELVHKSPRTDHIENWKHAWQECKYEVPLNVGFTCLSGRKIQIQSQNGKYKDNQNSQPFQEQPIKRPRKQDTQVAAGKKNTADKRRLLSSSSEKTWFVNRDTRSAITSSKVITRRVKNSPKAQANTKTTTKSKRKQKSNNHVNDVPRFMSIPSKFEDICKNKSVEEIMRKRSGDDFNNFQKSKTDSYPVNKRSPVCQSSKDSVIKWGYSTNIDFKQTDQQRNNKQQGYLQRMSSTTLQFEENTQVPKNIYIRRENGGEIMEDLVEVRNQDELDVLNTAGILTEIHNQYDIQSGTCFDSLKEYKVYFYTT